MKIERPSFYVNVDMHACQRAVVLNGMRVEEDFDGSTNRSSYPVSHFMRNGANVFELVFGAVDEMREIASDDSRCRAELRVRGSADGASVDFLVTDLELDVSALTGPEEQLFVRSAPPGAFAFQGSSEVAPAAPEACDVEVGPVAVGPDYFADGPAEAGDGRRLIRSFSLEAPFPEWAFFSAEPIDAFPMTEARYEAIMQELWPQLMLLWDRFEAGDLEAILPHFEARSAELDQAFYRAPGETLAILRSDIERVTRRGLPLIRLEQDYMQLIVEYNAKLATIVNAGDHLGSVRFRDEESDSVAFFDVSWMRKDGAWQIAR